MPKQSQRPDNLIPLTPAVFHILLAVADTDKHGYAIMQEVERLTGGKLRLGPATLYGAIKRLLVEGLLEESGERPGPELDDERRRYYRLTGWGGTGSFGGGPAAGSSGAFSAEETVAEGASPGALRRRER